jgi:hypothetical protein
VAPASTDAREPSLAARAKALWALRTDAGGLSDAIAAFHEAAEAAPEQPARWAALAEAHHFAAMNAALARDVELVVRHHALGLAAAERGLSATNAGDGVELAEVTRERAPALYWLARHRLGAARQSGFGHRIVQRPRAIAELERCHALDPSIDHGGPDRVLGSLRARPLSPALRALAVAREHFERAIAAAPDYLPTRLAFARDYAVVAQDRGVFERELSAVLEADPAKVQAMEPENRIAQAQARRLLSRAGELFE